MATAYLICGYIGVGKTTLAKQLEVSERAIRFTQDEWMFKLFGNYPEEATFNEEYLKVNQLINTVWPKCLALGMNVILDLNFWTRQSRDEARQIIAALNCEAKLYYLTCADDLAWTRIAARNLNLENGIYVSEKIFKTSQHKLEPLGKDEIHTEIIT